jgi:hypothetical protein
MVHLVALMFGGLEVIFLLRVFIDSMGLGVFLWWWAVEGLIIFGFFLVARYLRVRVFRQLFALFL